MAGVLRRDLPDHSGKIVESTNVWAQGEIPAEVRDQLPDNAKHLW